MYCHTCGTQVDSGVQFCPNCGQALSPSATAVSTTWVAPVGITAAPGRWIGQGWELVQSDFGNYILIALVFTLLNGVPFIQGALIAGFHIFTMKKLMGRPAEFGDLFKGFNYFVPTLVASILIGLFTFVGTLACIIPGLVVAAMYKFTYLFIIDKRMDFWPAMQASHSIVKQDYFGFTMFLLALIGINILGALCLVIGVFVSIPVTIAAI